jgi:hypothetical protein
MKEYYKLARPDGWDFYTGNTINYRDNIGKTVKCPKRGKAVLCSDTVLHASENPNDCFVGAKIPCSAYRVQGTSVLTSKDKCGFQSLYILEEIADLDALFGWKYSETINPINPLELKKVTKITPEHLKLLRQWDSVRASVWALVGDSVRDSVWALVGDSVRDSVWDSVWDSVGDSVWDSVWVSVGDSVRASVWALVGDSVRASVWDSVGAYTGSLFSIEKWEYIDHKEGEYPFQPAVDLWKMGLIPSFDGKRWRLHSGKKADIVWEGTIGSIKEGK